jgi:hypothetical protein
VTGFDAYTLYVSIKQHFNSNVVYNYVKYHGKSKTVNKETYQRRKDKFYFEAIGSKKKHDLLQFYVANFVVGDGRYIGDLYNAESEKVYFGWLKVIESLTYSFEQDIKEIKEFLEDRNLTFDDLFKVKDGDHPIMFRFVEQKMIRVETYIIMDQVLNFSKNFKEQITDEYIYPETQYKFDRYSEFMNFDKHKYEKIMRGVFV